MAKIVGDVVPVYKIVMELELWEVKELIKDIDHLRKTAKVGTTTLTLYTTLETILEDEDE